MTSVWVAEHGWCYLNAIIDCCTREIAGWSLDVCCRATGATAVVDAAAMARQIRPGELTLGTENGTALTARAFRARLAEHGITHRRRLPRPREPGLHRVLVLQAQGTLRLARRVREPRAGPRRDRHLRRRLSPPAPLRAGLPNAARRSPRCSRPCRRTARAALHPDAHPHRAAGPRRPLHRGRRGSV